MDQPQPKDRPQPGFSTVLTSEQYQALQTQPLPEFLFTESAFLSLFPLTKLLPIGILSQKYNQNPLLLPCGQIRTIKLERSQEDFSSRPEVVKQAMNSRTWEAEAKGPGFQGHLPLNSFLGQAGLLETLS